VTRKNSRGNSALEFALLLPFMTTLLLGTIGAGFGLLHNLEVIQLARDTGRLYAKQAQNINFALQGTQDILVTLAGDLGLQQTARGTTPNVFGTAGTGTAVVYVSEVLYLSQNLCPNGTASCANYEHWVFAQRIVIGNPSVDSSHFGSPSASIINSTTGTITTANYENNATAIANMTGVAALPTGAYLYVAEATGPGVSVPGFWNSPKVYSYAIF
jgi:hypothetical protein